MRTVKNLEHIHKENDEIKIICNLSTEMRTRSFEIYALSLPETHMHIHR